MTDPDLDAVREHVRRAYARAATPGVRTALDDALAELDACAPHGLAECPDCGRVGLPEQLAVHDCR